ncbi:hypothetical protein PTQ24_000071 [Salmonella phage KKP_3822]|uniref:Uncharacterized protein n=1 Tax=Salmonella phage KKP_3822 TaxID=3027681 RepID=A0AAX4NEX8_9CAUD
MSPKRHPDDIIVWPDKTWCYREELWERWIICQSVISV